MMHASCSKKMSRPGKSQNGCGAVGRRRRLHLGTNELGLGAESGGGSENVPKRFRPSMRPGGAWPHELLVGPARGRRRFTSSTVAVNRLTGGGWPGGRNISPDPISAWPRGPRIKLSRRSSVTFRSAQHTLRPSPKPNTNGNSVQSRLVTPDRRSIHPSFRPAHRLIAALFHASELLNWFFDRGKGILRRPVRVLRRRVAGCRDLVRMLCPVFVFYPRRCGLFMDLGISKIYLVF
jgi:hypothetical protein